MLWPCDTLSWRPAPDATRECPLGCRHVFPGTLRATPTSFETSLRLCFRNQCCHLRFLRNARDCASAHVPSRDSAIDAADIITVPVTTYTHSLSTNMTSGGGPKWGLGPGTSSDAATLIRPVASLSYIWIRFRRVVQTDVGGGAGQNSP